MISITLLDPVHNFSSNTYLIGSCGEYAVIDPSVPFSSSFIDGRLRYVLLTHAHFDHMLDIDSWASVPGAQVIVSRYDAEALRDPYRNCYATFLGRHDGYFGGISTVNSGDSLPLGDEFIDVISVPGHTQGSVIYKIGDDAFVGDLAFAGGGFGRADLPGGDFASLRDSLNLLSAMNESTVIYPGHGEETTVREFKNDYRIY